MECDGGRKSTKQPRSRPIEGKSLERLLVGRLSLTTLQTQTRSIDAQVHKWWTTALKGWIVVGFFPSRPMAKEGPREDTTYDTKSVVRDHVIPDPSNAFSPEYCPMSWFDNSEKVCPKVIRQPRATVRAQTWCSSGSDLMCSDLMTPFGVYPLGNLHPSGNFTSIRYHWTFEHSMEHAHYKMLADAKQYT